MTITKSDLIDTVLDNSSLRKADGAKFVDDFFEVMIKQLERDDSVKVPGFGNFILRDKVSRLGRNPKTKKEYPIAARRVVSFRTSNLLKAMVKDNYEKLKLEK